MVLEGESAVNESALTGESIPVDKAVGDSVSAATANQSGFLRCEATRVGEDTTLSQIIQMVSDAAATKAPIAKVADRVSGVFVPAVITIAVVTTAVWLLLRPAHRLRTGARHLRAGHQLPVRAGSGHAGRHHGRQRPRREKRHSLQDRRFAGGNRQDAKSSRWIRPAPSPRASRSVTDVLPADGVTESELLAARRLRWSSSSEHPLARAVMQRAEEDKLSAPEVSGFPRSARQRPDRNAERRSAAAAAASPSFPRKPTCRRLIRDTGRSALRKKAKRRCSSPGTAGCSGVIAVADVIKADSPQAIARSCATWASAS